MEENKASMATEVEEKVQNKDERKKRNILWPIFVLLILALGVGAYLWRDSECKKTKDADTKTISGLRKDKSDLEKQLADAKNTNTTTPTTTDCTATLPTASVKENVIASITSKNTAAIASYSAPKVRVVIAASEAAFDRTPDQAVKDIDYVVNAQEPWNFALDSATLAKYAAGPYKSYFKANSVVGVAKDKKVIVFNFNCTGNGRIEGVFMAANTDLLTE